MKNIHQDQKDQEEVPEDHKTPEGRPEKKRWVKRSGIFGLTAGWRGGRGVSKFGGIKVRGSCFTFIWL